MAATDLPDGMWWEIDTTPLLPEPSPVPDEERRWLEAQLLATVSTGA